VHGVLEPCDASIRRWRDEQRSGGAGAFDLQYDRADPARSDPIRDARDQSASVEVFEDEGGMNEIEGARGKDA
jgi:hypothetical protein